MKKRVKHRHKKISDWYWTLKSTRHLTQSVQLPIHSVSHHDLFHLFRLTRDRNAMNDVRHASAKLLFSVSLILDNRKIIKNGYARKRICCVHSMLKDKKKINAEKLNPSENLRHKNTFESGDSFCHTVQRRWWMGMKRTLKWLQHVVPFYESLYSSIYPSLPHSNRGSARDFYFPPICPCHVFIVPISFDVQRKKEIFHSLVRV